jgi:hypothetical protein
MTARVVSAMPSIIAIVIHTPTSNAIAAFATRVFISLAKSRQSFATTPTTDLNISNLSPATLTLELYHEYCREGSHYAVAEASP